MSDYGIDVSILPELEPVIASVVALGEQFVAAWEQLTPHLSGAFGSMSANWTRTTPEQRAVVAERCPNVVKAMQLRDRLTDLLSSVPTVDM